MSSPASICKQACHVTEQQGTVMHLARHMYCRMHAYGLVALLPLYAYGLMAFLPLFAYSPVALLSLYAFTLVALFSLSSM